jgi:putative hemolysin
LNQKHGDTPRRQITPVDPFLATFPGRTIGRLLSLDHLNTLYHRLLEHGERGCFHDQVLRALNINYIVSEKDLARIPKENPAIVVANHPYGAIDGLLLLSLLRKVRPDTKVMVNFILGKITELSDLFILVDPFESRNSISSNMKGLREALQWVKDGHLLVVFPAGEVSHIEWTKWVITDPEWSEIVARMVKHTGADVLPVYFFGSNSMLFQLAGLVHARLRTVMLPREMLKKAHKQIRIRIGNSILNEKCKQFENNRDLVKYLRCRTYMMSEREKRLRQPVPDVRVHDRLVELPRKPAFNENARQKEIEALPADHLLVSSDPYCVYKARADQIPNLLEEIGYLREMTFRGVGEGTGKDSDLDEFDRYYTQLFVWQKEKREIVGGYRLGCTDTIIQQYGRRGLYTYTLFKYGHRFLSRINPAMELGRSFIRPEYQKTYQALMLLWKGIGRIVATHPKYNILFGPVSITRDYDETSRHLIAAFFEENNQENVLARLVRPRIPLKPERHKKDPEFKASLNLLQDIQSLSDFISDLEDDGKGIPILLKQYLKLGGKSLAFNVDPNFSNALDSLILVDLTKTDRRILARYMGKENADAFLGHHRRENLADCA